MNMINILTALKYYSGFTMPTVSGLTQVVTWFITLFASTGVGVILFTLILKVITLPFDYASRASMRKNSVKMEEMRPELEKLQKQYANDKETYNLKMMEIYKKNGYSAFGSCLPTIITLVLFIVILSSFNKYSNYQNIKNLYDMNLAFNNVIDRGIEDISFEEEKFIYHDDEGLLVIEDNKIYNLKSAGDNIVTIGNLTATYNDDKVVYKTNSGYIIVEKNIIKEGEKVTFSTPTFYANIDNLDNESIKNEKGQTYNQYLLEINQTANDETASAFILDVQQTASANKYKEEKQSFLWVNNIWMTDSPFDHPVYKDYETLKSKYPEITNSMSVPSHYDDLTAKLGNEKSQVNGYFILVVLTALSSLLMQLVSQKSQKAQIELQSVDGSAAQTQKIMTWMMPIMMAVFAFMYTAAFSLYIITSSVVSILTTFLINKIVEIQLNNEKIKKEKESSNKYYGEKNRSKKGMRK